MTARVPSGKVLPTSSKLRLATLLRKPVHGLNSRIAGSNRSLKSKSAWFSHALPEAGSRGLQPLPGTPVQVASQ